MYVVFGILSKYIQHYLTFNYLIFLQSITGFLSSIIFLHFNKFKWHLLWKKFHLIYGIRIIVSLASMYAFIYGLKFVSVYNALVILNFCPFLMPVLRFVFFKQKIHSGIYAAILLAFVGLTLILSPDHYIFYLPTLIIVASMLCMAFSVLFLEHKSNANIYLSIFYYFLFSTLITGSALIISHNIVTESWYFTDSGAFYWHIIFSGSTKYNLCSAIYFQSVDFYIVLFGSYICINHFFAFRGYTTALVFNFWNDVNFHGRLRVFIFLKNGVTFDNSVITPLFLLLFT